MAVTNVLTPEDVEEQIKNVLREWLKLYFDGGIHDCGASDGLAKGFPDVDIAFDEFEAADVLDKPVIAIAKITPDSERSYGKKAGVNLFQTAGWIFEIFVARAHRETVDGTAYQWGRLADLLASRLGVLFTACRFQLTGSGLRFVRMTSSLPIRDHKKDFYIRRRHVTFRAETTVLFGSKATLGINASYAIS